MVTIASASLRSPVRAASSLARSSATSAASSATDSRSSCGQSCSRPTQARNQLVILGSPPTPNSVYFPAPAPGVLTSVGAGSRSALRYSHASRIANGPGRDAPVPPATRPSPVSSQHSTPSSRPIMRNIASSPAPSATAERSSLRRPRTRVIAVARSPLSRLPTSSVTVANEVSGGTASKVMPCRPHAWITSGGTWPRASPAPSATTPALTRADTKRSASPGSRHQIRPVSTRSPGVRYRLGSGRSVVYTCRIVWSMPETSVSTLRPRPGTSSRSLIRTESPPAVKRSRAP